MADVFMEDITAPLSNLETRKDRLTTLPPELLLRVCRSMDPRRPKDLCNLSLVSRRVSGEAQRTLYHWLILRTTSKLNRVIQILSQKPELASLVSKIYLAVASGPHSAPNQTQLRLLELVPRLKSLSLSPPPHHIGPLNAYAPLLEELFLDFNFGRVKNKMGIMVEQFWLPGLRTLGVELGDFTPEETARHQVSRYSPKVVIGLHLSQSLNFWGLKKREVWDAFLI